MSNPKPIVDVAHPNKSVPSGNSKSVIVTHHSRMQDPMVNVTSSETESPSPKTNKPTLQPLTAPLISSTDLNKTELPAPDKHVKLELKPLAASQETEEKVPTPEEQTETSEQTVKDGTVEVNQQVVDAEKVKADAVLQKLVDSKRYFLPIDTLENRRVRRFVIAGILLSLVMVIAWLDIALDAGLITIDGIKPLTNFFST